VLFAAGLSRRAPRIAGKKIDVTGLVTSIFSFR